jgi:hypothetical protein
VTRTLKKPPTIELVKPQALPLATLGGKAIVKAKMMVRKEAKATTCP